MSVVFAVARRRDQEQHAHLIGALGGAGRADLLGEVAADQRQVDLVDQPVAHERRHHARPELVEPQPPALALGDLALDRAVGAERRDIAGAEPVEPRGQLVEPHRQRAAGEPGMAAEQARHRGLDHGARGHAR